MDGGEGVEGVQLLTLEWHLLFLVLVAGACLLVNSESRAVSSSVGRRECGLRERGGSGGGEEQEERKGEEGARVGESTVEGGRCVRDREVRREGGKGTEGREGKGEGTGEGEADDCLLLLLPLSLLLLLLSAAIVALSEEARLRWLLLVAMAKEAGYFFFDLQEREGKVVNGKRRKVKSCL